MGGRRPPIACALIAGLLTLASAGCRSGDGLAERRAELLARNCVSTMERREGDDLDRIALAEIASPDDFAEFLDRPPPRPSSVSALRRVCRFEESDSDEDSS